VLCPPVGLSIVGVTPLKSTEKADDDEALHTPPL
jgi:hypothetical protein